MEPVMGKECQRGTVSTSRGVVRVSGGRCQGVAGVIARVTKSRTKKYQLTDMGSNIVSRSSPVKSYSLVMASFFDIPEELSTVLHTLHNPNLPINVDSAQCFRLCLLKPGLSIPNSSLQLHCAAQRIWVIDRVQLGMFNMSVCLVKPLFTESQPRQGVMNPK